jgi:hypothetical protein
MTNQSPNDEAFLKSFGIDDLENEPIDPNVPDEWRELEPIAIIPVKEDEIDAKLSDYDDGRFEAEYRSVELDGQRLHYVLTFVRGHRQ